MKKVTDLQLRHLETKHQRLDTEVEQLMRRVHMTPGEYQQAIELKKRKLLVKDGIEALRQDTES
jgi:hypothetical protein